MIRLEPYRAEKKEQTVWRIAQFFGFHTNLKGGSRTIGTTNLHLAEETLAEWLVPPKALYLIVNRDSDVGFLRLNFRGGNVAWIEDIYVDEACRGRGYATAAIAAAEEIVRADPRYTAICLDVIPRNQAALRLYRRLGYDTLSMRSCVGRGESVPYRFLVMISAIEKGETNMKLKKLTVCADLAGCPNRCRHCWLGHAPNGDMTPDDLRAIAAAFRPHTETLVLYDWYREPDYRDDYRALWSLCSELSDEPRDHFELMSVWRAVRDPEYVPWLASLGLRAMQLTMFGGREKTDFYTGRKGAYDDILQAIDILIENKIAPRIQYFVFKDTIDELSHLEALIDSLRLEARCQAFGGDFSCFVHAGSCDGAGERLYNRRITETDLVKIPPRIAAYTLRHFQASSLQEVFGEAESVLYARLCEDHSVASLVEDEPVFYVDHRWDVYPNITAAEPAWRLGNLLSDGAEAILQTYRNSQSSGQRLRLTTPLGEIIAAAGDPESQRLFGDGDYIQLCLNRCLRGGK